LKELPEWTGEAEAAQTVIPREGVESSVSVSASDITAFVIPREGVERITLPDRIEEVALSTPVIPREGVERL